MTTAQEQYTQIVTQNQEAVKTAVENWKRTVEETFGQLPVATPVDPNQVIDQVFEYSTKLITAQRDFSKHLVASSTAAAEAIQKGTAALKEAATV